MKNSALILQNLQIDYFPGGAMEVLEGDLVIPIVNQLMQKFEFVIAAIDWHPANHISFAGNHPWRHIGQIISIDGLDQELLPFHCVQHSFGAHLHPTLEQGSISHTIYQGTAANQDNYSCFYDVDKRRDTGLDAYLEQHNIKNLFFLGLPLESNVKHSCLDAIDLQYKTFLVEDASKAWCKTKDSEKKAMNALKKAGVIILDSEKLLSINL